MKEWFKARNAWGAAIFTLSDDEAGRLMKALWKYTMTGEKANLIGPEKGIFALILMILSQDEERDSEISGKRAIAGALGGKQTQAKPSKTKQKQANAFRDQANQAIAPIRIKNKNKEQEQEKEKEPEQERSTGRFAPPTLDQVAEYCRERGNKIDPQHFIDFYQTRGWVLSSGQRVRDWKACIRTWEKRDSQQPASRPAKTVLAQQYEQRDYSGSDDDWTAVLSILQGEMQQGGG